MPQAAESKQYLSPLKTMVLIFYFCSVKILCLILSIYVVLLSLKPCCADKDCQAMNLQKVNSEKQSHKKECTGCSPFFTCGSCVGFIISKPFLFTSSLIKDNPIKSYIPYEQPATKEITLTIWQPPKIG
ncbi:hypothetical protein ABIB50_003274 [Mucilaginibacter sp. UYCu711]